MNPDTGFVMDLRELKDALSERVAEDVDHRNLNVEVPWLDDVIPSTENFAVAIWGRLADAVPKGVRLHRVFLRETENNAVEYLGPDRNVE